MDALDTVARALAYPVSIGILANGLDELWIDLNFFVRGLYRRERRGITREELRAVPQRRIAIMVPAWQEANVIRQMLEHNLRGLDYELGSYDFFLGTYPNDAETQARVDEVTRIHRNVHKVVLPHDGPTSKADCLNWVYQGIVLEEQRSGRRFDILLMHDAEDVIHPQSLRLCSLLIPRHEFVQMPVFSLELPRTNLVGSTYIDEFAEHHLREMPVREALKGLIPSAGVGSAFDRNAFEDIAARHGQQPFSTSSLTEDYEIGLKFRLAGKRVHFACRTLERPAREPGTPGASTRPPEEYLATREYFPDTFWASVRQRSRWILGITLQTWQQLGWQGPLPVLYCLWRDRKALFTNALLLGAYGLLAYVFTRSSVSAVEGAQWGIDDVAPKGSWLAWILVINLLLLVWRLGMKCYAVNRLYGPGQALMSVPRLMLGNLISLMATSRALFQFLRHLVTGQPLRWLKTAHAFPSTHALAAPRERLGEYLVARGVLSQGELSQALSLREGTQLRLGEVLTATGLLPERTVTGAVGELLGMQTLELETTAISPELLARMPEEEAERREVLLVGTDAEGRIVLACAEPLPEGSLRELEARLGRPLSPRLVPREALRRVRERAYRRLQVPGPSPAAPPLGAWLLERGLLKQEELQRALAWQAETGEPLADLLVRRGMLSPGQLSELTGALGSFRAISPEHVDLEALRALGYGPCAFHTLVPLRETSSAARAAVASAFPVHPVVLEGLGQRLGRPLQAVLAPGLQVRLALAVAARRAWPRGLLAGLGGLEGAELATLLREASPRGDPEQLLRRARARGCLPLDSLEAQGQLSPLEVARLRANAYCLRVAPPEERPDARGAVPPGLAALHGIHARELSPGELVLASVRPTPALARQVGALYPERAVCWQVLPARSAGALPTVHPPHAATEEP